MSRPLGAHTAPLLPCIALAFVLVVLPVGLVLLRGMVL